MKGASNDSRETRGITALALGIVLTLGWIPAVSDAEPSETPPAAEIFPDLSADLQSTLIDRSGHTAVTIVHIYRSGKMVRYEHTRTDPPEIWIMDYGDLKEYRIYAGDKIYFETPIAHRLSYKAQREGLIPPEARPEIVERRIHLREDTLEGHPCDLVLLVRSIKDRKDFGADYTLIWEARDLDNQWIRVAYHQANYTLFIQDLRSVKLGPVDPELLHPPNGFAGMSPY
jgi:hypothetical protein